MERKKFKKGKLIVRENDPGEDMYVIASGKVSVYKTINQERVILGVLEKNDFFGEMSLLLGHDRSATVEALEPTVVVVFTKEDLEKRLHENASLVDRMLKTMARRLLECHDIISDLEGEKRSLEIIYGQK